MEWFILNGLVVMLAVLIVWGMVEAFITFIIEPVIERRKWKKFLKELHKNA